MINRSSPFIALCLFIILLPLPKSVYCQSGDNTLGIHPYKVNYWVTGGICAVGGVANYFAIQRIKDKPPLTDTELLSLNEDAINSFDQWVLDQDPTKIRTWDKNSDYILTSSIFLPGLLMLDGDMRSDWLDLLLIYAETHAITANLFNYSFMGPTFQNKFRPVAYYDELSMDERRNGNSRNSFYSGHVASCAVPFFLMAKMYSDYHPKIGAKKYLLYTAAAVPPAVLGYMRVKALKHFPSDCLVGLGVGAACGILIPELHKIKSDHLSMSMFTVPGGGGLSLAWQP